MPLVCYIIHLGLNATSYEPRSVVLSVQRPVSYFVFRHYRCKDHLIVIYSITIIGMLISDLGLIVMLAQRAMSSKLKSYLKPTFAHKHSAHHNIQTQQTQPNAESLAQPKCPTTSTEPISFTEVFRHLQHLQLPHADLPKPRHTRQRSDSPIGQPAMFCELQLRP